MSVSNRMSDKTNAPWLFLRSVYLLAHCAIEASCNRFFFTKLLQSNTQKSLKYFLCIFKPVSRHFDKSGLIVTAFWQKNSTSTEKYKPTSLLSASLVHSSLVQPSAASNRLPQYFTCSFLSEGVENFNKKFLFPSHFVFSEH